MAVFVATVETGSMAAAARALELNATLVSRQIQQLEEQLEVPLFERKGRWQRLTDAGRQYHRQCRSILEMVQEAESGLGGRQEQVRGLLRVHAPVTFGVRQLAPALAGFLGAHPQVRVELVLDDRVVDPLEDGYDAVFHLGPVLADDLEVLALGEQPVVMVASPQYLERQGRPEHAQALLEHRCLGFLAPGSEAGPGDEMPDDEAEVLADGLASEASEDGGEGVFPLTDESPAEASELAPAIVLQTNNALALQALALQGAGITVLPHSLVAADLESGRLVALLEGCLPSAEPLSLVTASDADPASPLQVLIAWASRQFGPPEAADGPPRA